MICSAAAAARIIVCSEHMEMLPAAAEACFYDTLTGIPGICMHQLREYRKYLKKY